MEQPHKPCDWVTSQLPEALKTQYLEENPNYSKVIVVDRIVAPECPHPNLQKL